jgi:hypothetical protein
MLDNEMRTALRRRRVCSALAGITVFIVTVFTVPWLPVFSLSLGTFLVTWVAFSGPVEQIKDMQYLGGPYEKTISHTDRRKNRPSKQNP